MTPDRQNLRPLHRPDPGGGADAGADMVGFVFFAKSPRARRLRGGARAGRAGARPRADRRAQRRRRRRDARRGSSRRWRPTSCNCMDARARQRVSEIGERFGRPTMKAIGVAAPADFAAARPTTAVADLLLIDAKPPKDAALPGGNGRLSTGASRAVSPRRRPWLLSGGLDADNVAEAIALTGARGRRRLLGRRERAGRQGRSQDRGVRRRGARGLRPRDRRSRIE